MIISAIKKREYGVTLEMVRESFWEYDASYYPRNGQDSFLAYASFPNFAYRQWHSHSTFVAKDQTRILGMIEIRGDCHISMLFVAPNYIKQGIGRALITTAVERCVSRKMNLRYITVNSSLFAEEFYKKMGFTATESPTTNDGLTCIPMALAV